MDIPEIKAKAKIKVPKTAEQYLLKRIMDLEEELADFKKYYASINSQLVLTRQMLKDKEKETDTNLSMLRFLWDYVINYDPIRHVICADSKHIVVPGNLQDDFKLWQSFKDNPEGGGV